jgi:hypothetical protein
MSTDIKEVELLFPQGKEVTVKGEQLVIKPLGFGKFPKLLHLLKGIQDVKATPEGKPMKMDTVDLIVNNADSVVEFCALCTGKPRSYFDDVPMDEAVSLVSALVAVNADFFVKRLQPKLLGVLSEVTALVGGLSSPDLSQPAIV